MDETPFYSIYGVPADSSITDMVHVEHVNDRSALHAGQVQAHCHPHLHQMSLWTGVGVYSVAGHDHVLGAGSLTIVPPNVIHGFTTVDEADALVLSVSAAFIAEARAWLGGDTWSVLEVPSVLALSPVAADRLNVLFRSLAEESRYAAPHDRQAIACQLQLAVILVDRLSGLQGRGRGETSDERLLRSFLLLVDEKLRLRWTMARYVDALGTTEHLLNRATRAASGRTPSDVIRARTVAEAKRMLLFSKASAAEVGHLLGFDDPAHFGRYFQRVANTLPGAWRRQETQRLRKIDQASTEHTTRSRHPQTP